MGCEINVLISMTSPFLAFFGTRMRGVIMTCLLSVGPDLVDTGAKRHDDASRARPHRSILHLRQCKHRLRPSQTDVCADLGFPRTYPEMIGGCHRLRIAGDEDMDALDVIVWRHRAVDGDRQRHGVAGLGDLRQGQAYAARLWFAFADELPNGLLHVLRRRPGAGRPYG